MSLVGSWDVRNRFIGTPWVPGAMTRILLKKKEKKNHQKAPQERVFSMDCTESELILRAMWLLQVVKVSPLGMVYLHTAIQDYVCRCWTESLSPFLFCIKLLFFEGLTHWNQISTGSYFWLILSASKGWFCAAAMLFLQWFLADFFVLCLLISLHERCRS